MKKQVKLRGRAVIAAILTVFSLNVLTGNSYAQQAPVKNIVIVHGALADGSGFKGVYDILTRKGYHVSVVQNPLTSLKDDVEATNRILDRQDGPAVLVGHSWGGTVITEAGVQLERRFIVLIYRLEEFFIKASAEIWNKIELTTV